MKKSPQKRPGYREGQRWELRSGIPEFEPTAVIAGVNKPHPEWGEPETKYVIYVRYSRDVRDSLPPDVDGEVLELNAKGMDRSLTKRVESGVKLPWWWQYGHRIKRKRDTPRSSGVYLCNRISEALPRRLQEQRQRAEYLRQRQAALQRHLEKFPSGTRAGPMSQSVKESWKRIRAWMRKHAPGYQFDLNPGAPAAAVKAFEKTIGVTLPDDFRESVRLHDGGNCWVLPSHGDLLSLEEILKQWKMYKEWQENGTYAVGDGWIASDVKGPIKNIFWNVKRIYITDNSGDHLTLDLDPPEDGVYGQIVEHSHEVGPLKVVAASWSDFLGQLVDDLESGKYVYLEFHSSISPLKEFMESEA